jgi:hypothetical protein
MINILTIIIMCVLFTYIDAVNSASNNDEPTYDPQEQNLDGLINELDFMGWTMDSIEEQLDDIEEQFDEYQNSLIKLRAEMFSIDELSEDELSEDDYTIEDLSIEGDLSDLIHDISIEDLSEDALGSYTVEDLSDSIHDISIEDLPF